ncbi:MAG TPA: hypothetical protein VGJ14_18185 [Sporichthyaceae bacterium]
MRTKSHSALLDISMPPTLAEAIIEAAEEDTEGNISRWIRQACTNELAARDRRATR